MANLRAKYLYPEQIDEIVTPLLTEAFKSYGYKDKTIKEDEIFDGEPVIRVTADVERAVPARELANASNRIHDALREKDEERIDFLSAPGPDRPLESGEKYEE